MIFVLCILHHNYRKSTKNEFNWSASFRDINNWNSTFMYLQYSRPNYLSPFAKCLEGVVHHEWVHIFNVSH